jgi:hypothetical protein
MHLYLQSDWVRELSSTYELLIRAGLNQYYGLGYADSSSAEE